MTPALTVGLVGCGKSKLGIPAPARELYTGGLFLAAAAYCDRRYDRWYVVSAKHHLVAPDQVIAPYDESLMGRPWEVRRGWAHVIQAMLCGEYQAGRIDAGRVTFFVHAGREYAEPLRFVLGRERCELPLEGLGIGSRLAWYARQASPPMVRTRRPADGQAGLF